VQNAPPVDQLAETRPPRLGRQPAFDGARGVAWLVVFAAHANLVADAAVGQVAMFFFFALSGFLITALLLGERHRTGRISLGHFFARRALRLLPALYLFLAAWLAVALLLPHSPWLTTVPGGGTGPGEPWTVALEGIGAAVGYLSNWANVFGLFSGYFPLGHLWSLAVEEQFYVVWAPLLALLLARGRRIGTVIALLVAASLLDVAFLHAHPAGSTWVDMGTDTRAGAFLAGALASLAWHRRHATVVMIQGRWRVLASAASFGAFVWAAVVFKHPASQTQFVLAFALASLAAPVMVLTIMGPGSGPRHALAHPVLVYLGRRSYALYLWHYVWLTWLRGWGLAGVVGALAVTLLCGEASWRLVEARALARKTRFSGAVATPRLPTAVDGSPLARPREILRPDIGTAPPERVTVTAS
jgi:peptidoglycan/LPS O-acetylase OafA/YrhL